MDWFSSSVLNTCTILDPRNDVMHLWFCRLLSLYLMLWSVLYAVHPQITFFNKVTISIKWTQTAWMLCCKHKQNFQKLHALNVNNMNCCLFTCQQNPRLLWSTSWWELSNDKKNYIQTLRHSALILPSFHFSQLSEVWFEIGGNRVMLHSIKDDTSLNDETLFLADFLE